MTTASPPLPIDFYFDPTCPWTWITSRWLVEAAEQRNLAVTWRPFSLMVHNGEDVPEEYRHAVEESHRALRVIVALDAGEGNDAVHAFYTERGHRQFDDGTIPDLVEVLTAAGLDPTYADAADDESLDAVILTAMDEARRLTGGGTGSPIIVIDGHDHGFFGPVLTAVPRGDDVGRLWDHFAALSTIPELYEIKRERDTDPVFPPRKT